MFDISSTEARQVSLEHQKYCSKTSPKQSCQNIESFPVLYNSILVFIVGSTHNYSKLWFKQRKISIRSEYKTKQKQDQSMKTKTRTTTTTSSLALLVLLYSCCHDIIIRHVQYVHGAADISDCGSPNDPCMNDGNYNQCIELVEVDGCQQLFVMESCPLQFGCGDDEDDGQDPPSTNPCGNPTDPCMNDENYNECIQLVEVDGCQQVFVMESCPSQFGCDDEGDGDDGDDNKYEFCDKLSKTDFACMNDENHKECIEYIDQGCQNIATMESCPLQFGCGDDDENDTPDVPSMNTTNTSSTTYFCDDLFTIDATCMNDDNYMVCVDLIVNQNCQDVAILKSCPLQFACNDYNTTDSGEMPDSDGDGGSTSDGDGDGDVIDGGDIDGDNGSGGEVSSLNAAMSILVCAMLSTIVASVL